MPYCEGLGEIPPSQPLRIRRRSERPLKPLTESESEYLRGRISGLVEGRVMAQDPSRDSKVDALLRAQIAAGQPPC